MWLRVAITPVWGIFLDIVERWRSVEARGVIRERGELKKLQNQCLGIKIQPCCFLLPHMMQNRSCRDISWLLLQKRSLIGLAPRHGPRPLPTVRARKK